MAEHEALASTPDAHPMRLLYVEDNRLNAMLFEESLRSHPAMELRIAFDGADAMTQLVGWTPDLLVLDAHLPDMDGFELLSLLRQQAPLAQIPAFMCSADTSQEDIDRALASGFSGFWPKPIDIRQILNDLQRISAQHCNS